MTLPIAAILVARLGSKRLHHKPLISIDGRTLVQHAIDACLAAACFDEVIVASEAPDRLAISKRHSRLQVIQTDAQHRSGTSRLSEVYAHLNRPPQSYALVPCDVFPLTADSLEAFVAACDAEIPVTTTVARLSSELDDGDPAKVKLVHDEENNVLGFYRLPEHSRWDRSKAYIAQQLGLNLYSSTAVEHFIKTPPSPEEDDLQNETIRFLGSHLTFKCTYAARRLYSINVLEDLAPFGARVRLASQ